jgi:hypothetical protein
MSPVNETVAACGTNGFSTRPMNPEVSAAFAETIYALHSPLSLLTVRTRETSLGSSSSAPNEFILNVTSRYPVECTAVIYDS